MSFGGWTPVNYERTYQGTVTVVEALAESLNVPTAYLGSLLGPPHDRRHRPRDGYQRGPARGAADFDRRRRTTLLELASAYQVFAERRSVRGRRTRWSRWSMAKGHLIYQHAPHEQR